MRAFRQRRNAHERRAGDAEVNAAAWGLWFAAVAVIPLVTRNPLYLALALLVVLAVYLSLPKAGGAARAWRVFVMVGATLALVSVLFNVLTVHIGDRVFARLPEGWPIIGGALTWNALVYGLLSAMAIATLLLAAATFNTVVRQGDVIRLLPGRFASLGVAGSIAVTAVPSTMATARDIYDAQRARGQQFRGVRDARGLLVPLLGTGMERALTLAEALETRGFGASASGVPQLVTRPTLPGRLVVGVPVVLLAAALALLGAGRVIAGLSALGLAVVVALRVVPGSGRGRVTRTRFRPLRWDTASLVVAGASVTSALGMLLMPGLSGTTLAYDSFPRLNAPPFAPPIGMAILLLLTPLFWRVAERGQ
jgi:energy-coupling factor transport system permease protein